MSRAKWKGPYLENGLIGKLNKKDTYNLKTKSRKSTIVPIFVGKSLIVHNGKNFLKIKVTKHMVGRKIGEFVPTRKKFSFKKTKK